MTNTKRQISRYIADHPGVHFNALVRELNLAPGQVQYHLRNISETNDFVQDRLYGRTHYFSAEYDEWARATLALARRETARDIIFFFLENGPSSPNTVASTLGVARSTLEYHLDHLVEQGIVEKRRDERNRVTLVLTQPTETTHLLQNIAPSFPERMVDRFTRLVDKLLMD